VRHGSEQETMQIVDNKALVQLVIVELDRKRSLQVLDQLDITQLISRSSTSAMSALQMGHSRL
jgi:hypothetical protein